MLENYSLRRIQQAVRAVLVEACKSHPQTSSQHEAIAELLEGRQLLSGGGLSSAAGGPSSSPLLAWTGYTVQSDAQGTGNSSGGASIHVISGVPAYLWLDGCGPTSAGMVLGYWDSLGYGNLVAGDASWQTSGVDEMIASTGHHNDYALPIDDDTTGVLLDKSSTGGAHASNSVADFMHTSWSSDGLCYGWSYTSYVPSALDEYANFAGYSDASAFQRSWGGFTWAEFTAEIDAGRPLVFLVDSDADGSTDHFVPAIGYDSSGSVQRYACYNTWDTSIHWYDFTSMAPGQSFGIYDATFFDPGDGASFTQLSATSISENQAVGTTVGTLSSDDPDTSKTFTYSLVDGYGSDDNSSFQIVGDRLVTRGSFDYEGKTSYTVRVRATEGNGLFTEKKFTIGVTNVDEVPTNIVLPTSSIAENQPVGTLVNSLSSIDPDAGDTFTYSLVSGEGSTDNSLFQIVAGQLRTAASFDYEAVNSYTVRVRSTDAGGLFTEKVFTITVTNANDAPSDVMLSGSSVAENQAAGTLIGTLSSTDPDGDSVFAYTLVSVNGLSGSSAFQIVNGQVKTTAALDYEARSSYTLRIRSTDAGGQSYEKVFTVTVTDANDAPTDLALSSTRVLRLWPAGNLVGTLSAVDPDASGTAGMIYSLVAGEGATHNSMFRIEGTQLKLSTMVPTTGVASYSIRIRATDVGGKTYEEAVAIRVAGTNVVPIDMTLNPIPARVAEHQPAGTLAGTLRTADANEGDTFTYSLIRTATYPDNAAFTIVGDQLLTTRELNYEIKSSYSIMVRVADAGGLSYSELMTVGVNNVNEAPSSLGLIGRTVLENKPAGTVVGILGTTDGDIGNTFTYTLVEGEGSTDNAAFSILGNQLKTVRRFGYEQKSAYSVRVRVTDQGGLSYEKVFAIRVIDVNEAPTEITLGNSSLAENNLPGALVGRLGAIDPDAASTSFVSAITYSLVPGIGSTDNAVFAIVGNRLNTLAAFNYEARNSYTLRVRATDQGGLFCEKAITVTVGDVNERPNNLRLTTPGATTPSVTRNMLPGTLAGTLTGRDPDLGSILTYSLISGTGSDDNAKFAIVGNQLLVGSGTLTYTTTQSYKVRVRVTDQFGLYFDQAFVLGVRAA